MADSDLAEVWARSLDGLADLQIQPHQRAWLKLTRPLGLVENTALIATPNEFVKEQLETRLRPLVTQALSQELGRDIQLAVTVDPSAAARAGSGRAGQRPGDRARRADDRGAPPAARRGRQPEDTSRRRIRPRTRPGRRRPDADPGTPWHHPGRTARRPGPGWAAPG